MLHSIAYSFSIYRNFTVFMLIHINLCAHSITNLIVSDAWHIANFVAASSHILNVLQNTYIPCNSNMKLLYGQTYYHKIITYFSL